MLLPLKQWWDTRPWISPRQGIPPGWWDAPPFPQQARRFTPPDPDYVPVAPRSIPSAWFDSAASAYPAQRGARTPLHGTADYARGRLSVPLWPDAPATFQGRRMVIPDVVAGDGFVPTGPLGARGLKSSLLWMAEFQGAQGSPGFPGDNGTPVVSGFYFMIVD